ncbi:MAG: type II toxin-antitoxin system PrlF family antitoxin [Clostridiales Family XIII bacterium]|jgi:AbrB family looped-hinge helix DNA binding protein|nr:type II toxin-antitoxin system PrlF family antitoxin [Clostridiales Family XIII bacterium]
MNLAKVSANGQITVPVEIRRLLGVKEGDKILFFRNDKGEIVIDNASESAILNAQNAFRGVAENLGNPSEDEIQSWVYDVRYGKEE